MHVWPGVAWHAHATERRVGGVFSTRPCGCDMQAIKQTRRQTDEQVCVGLGMALCTQARQSRTTRNMCAACMLLQAEKATHVLP
eukprot:364784-Chlamydomonas_euryale.AAC.6